MSVRARLVAIGAVGLALVAPLGAGAATRPASVSSLTVAVSGHRVERGRTLCAGAAGCVYPTVHPCNDQQGTVCVPFLQCIVAATGFYGPPLQDDPCAVDVFLTIGGKALAAGRPAAGVRVSGSVTVSFSSTCWPDANLACALRAQLPDDPPHVPYVEGVEWSAKTYRRTIAYQATTGPKGTFSTVVGSYRFHGGASAQTPCAALRVKATAASGARSTSHDKTRTVCG